MTPAEKRAAWRDMSPDQKSFACALRDTFGKKTELVSYQTIKNSQLEGSESPNESVLADNDTSKEVSVCKV